MVMFYLKTNIVMVKSRKDKKIKSFLYHNTFLFVSFYMKFNHLHQILRDQYLKIHFFKFCKKNNTNKNKNFCLKKTEEKKNKIFKYPNGNTQWYYFFNGKRHF